MQPLLSIVIANYNYGRFLSEAIESVLFQKVEKVGGGGQRIVNSSEVELIIIDGGSTDNSVEVIQKYAGGLPPGIECMNFNSDLDHHSSPSMRDFNSKITYWVSEPDKGQSNAFNKGFAHAHGRFLTWLNADDVMLPGTIEKLRIAAEKHPTCEWFVGGVLWLDPEMRIINCGRGRPFSEIRYREGNVSAWGPSSFFTKRLLDSVGGVDERFHYTMDTDLWYRFACKANERYLPFCDYAWGLRLHPEAKMSGQNFANDDVKRIHAEKVAREKAMSLEGACVMPSTRWSRLRSVSWAQVLAAKLDLARWRGRNYSEVFK